MCLLHHNYFVLRDLQNISTDKLRGAQIQKVFARTFVYHLVIIGAAGIHEILNDGRNFVPLLCGRNNKTSREKVKIKHNVWKKLKENNRGTKNYFCVNEQNLKKRVCTANLSNVRPSNTSANYHNLGSAISLSKQREKKGNETRHDENGKDEEKRNHSINV